MIDALAPTPAALTAPTAPLTVPRPAYLRIAGQPDREYYVFIPDETPPDAEPLVLVHGISRNAAELVTRFAVLASRHRVPLIAPLFTREAYGQYQQVHDRKRDLRSDLALCDILADAARRFGLATQRIALFGFSGGAQFAHRFALMHPHLVRVCIPVSAGWYSMPDPRVAWPLGLADIPGDGPGALARTVPFHVIVGQRETISDDALRHDPELDRLQGSDRRSRAKTWHRAMQRAGFSPGGSLTVLPRTRHNFACAHRRGLAETVFRLIGHEG